MRKSHSSTSRLSYPQHPSLFDGLDAGSGQPDFEIIPPDKMQEAAQAVAASRPAPAIDALPEITPTDHLFFMSFGSGSSGNCSYVGDRRSGFLIDAGIDARRVMKDLRDNGIMPESVKGILLTHDHHDHISQAYPLLRSYRHLKLYCTPRTLNGMLRRRNVSRRIKDYHVPVYKEFPFKIDAFTITPFEVSHDGADNVGFFIEHGPATMAVATDLGCITDRVDFYMRQASSIVLEANYDLQKLVTGTYPEHLKARILHATGHLDNKVSAAFAAKIYTPALRNIFLCHLSHDNNTPALAVGAYAGAFAPLGITQFESSSVKPDELLGSSGPRLCVVPLPRYESTPLYTL